MRVAIVIDSLLGPGGDKKLLNSLLEAYKEADVYTTMYNKNLLNYIPNLSHKKVFTSFLNKKIYKKTFSSHYTILSTFAFENFTFDQYDLVISMSTGPAKGIITSTNTKHISIILTPTRYYWRIDNPANYTKRLKHRQLLRPPLWFINVYSRIYDYQSAQRSDSVVSISSYIQRIIKKIYGRKSDVVFPPVVLPKVTLYSSNKIKDKYHLPAHYLVCMSRLYPYKRIDIAIKVCIEKNLSLVIVGDGPDLKKYLAISRHHPNIRVLGWLQDKDAYSILKQADTLIFPGIEDFGIIIAESIMLGTPVCAYNNGGATDIVTENVTGSFFNTYDLEEIYKSLQKCHKMKITVKNKQQLSEKFSFDKFKNKLQSIVKSL